MEVFVAEFHEGLFLLIITVEKLEETGSSASQLSAIWSDLGSRRTLPARDSAQQLPENLQLWTSQE